MTPTPQTTEQRLADLEARLAALEVAAQPLAKMLDSVLKVFLPQLSELILRPRALAMALREVLRARDPAEAEAFEAAFNREMAHEIAMANLIRDLMQDWDDWRHTRGGEA